MLVTALLLTLQAPPILTRSVWGARPPVLPMKPHVVRYLTVHHAGVATKKEVPNVTKLRNLQAWCQRKDKLAGGREKPAWPDIPYHYYIFHDGQIAEARDWRFVGDTNTTYDPTGHLLICLEGNFETEKPTEAQLQSLRQATAWLATTHKVPRVRIGGHGDFAETSCPGKNLVPYVRSLGLSY
jgi:hypothetical protein